VVRIGRYRDGLQQSSPSHTVFVFEPIVDPGREELPVEARDADPGLARDLREVGSRAINDRDALRVTDERTPVILKLGGVGRAAPAEGEGGGALRLFELADGHVAARHEDRPHAGEKGSFHGEAAKATGMPAALAAPSAGNPGRRDARPGAPRLTAVHRA